MTSLHLDDQLCFALYAASQVVCRAYQPRLRALGITYPEYLAMIVMWQVGPVDEDILSKKLHMDPRSVGDVMRRPADAGFAEPFGAMSERRIALTTAGVALDKYATTAQQAVVCDTELAPSELAALRDDLRSLITRMAKQ